MNPWIETLLVTLFSCAGAPLGLWFSRLPKPYWTFGYFFPAFLILALLIGGKFPSLQSSPPCSWLMSGRTPFAVIGFIAALILTTPLSRIPRRQTRILILFLLAWFVGQSAIWPFLSPACNRSYFAALKTNIDGDGICRQSTQYSCGPASAVTALRKLGLPAEEGDLAILARTSAAIGTPPSKLAQTLEQRYGAAGLKARFRYFESVSELKDFPLTLAVIKLTFLVDHYVVVLEVTDDKVVMGDPFRGKWSCSHAEFLSKWEKLGITLEMPEEKRPELSKSLPVPSSGL